VIFLIVDDDLSQLHLVQALLRELNVSHECHYAANGPQALNFLNRRPPFERAPRPDLVLLDLDLPGMNGYQVLQHLKHDPNLRSIPTIILSSSRAIEDVNACYEEHANAFVQKPTDLDESLRVLEGIDRFWSRVQHAL